MGAERETWARMGLDGVASSRTKVGIRPLRSCPGSPPEDTRCSARSRLTRSFPASKRVHRCCPHLPQTSRMG